jgi:hypothetical protein
MLKLRTRTQQTLALIVTAWCASSATGVCDRALKNAQKVKNVSLFSAASAILLQQVLTERCTANKTLKTVNIVHW